MKNLNVITEKIIACAIEVHRELGPGLLESIYEKALCYELHQSNLQVKNQVLVPVIYKNLNINDNYKLDVLVENQIIIELKSITELLPIHHAQLLTYLKLTKKKLGLLINFNVPTLKDGIKRKIL